MTTEAYLGVDAGNSKTVAVVADAGGHVLGRGRAGTGDIYGSGGAEGAIGEVVKAARAALEDAGLAESAIRSAAFRLAGVDWPEDEELWHDAIGSHLPRLARFSVRNDGYSLIPFGDDPSVGVSALAGTGAAIAARGPGGHEFSLSFWIQDDLGALGLGGSAVRAVVRADLGIAPPTALSSSLLLHFEVDDVAELLHSFTRRDEPRSPWSRATASRPVLAAAAAGDAVAVAIVRQQAEDFARYIAAAGRRVHLWDDRPFCVSLGGGLVSAAHPVYRNELTRAISASLPRATVRVVEAAPVIGAVLEALLEDGRAAAPQLRRLLETEAHPEEFLLT